MILRPIDRLQPICCCLGMAAFFSIFAFGGIVLLLWKGEAIRQLSFKSISSNEGGMRIMEKEEVSSEV